MADATCEYSLPLRPHPLHWGSGRRTTQPLGTCRPQKDHAPQTDSRRTEESTTLTTEHDTQTNISAAWSIHTHTHTLSIANPTMEPNEIALVHRWFTLHKSLLFPVSEGMQLLCGLSEGGHTPPTPPPYMESPFVLDFCSFQQPLVSSTFCSLLLCSVV